MASDNATCTYRWEGDDHGVRVVETCSKRIECRIDRYCHKHCLDHIGVIPYLVEAAKVKFTEEV